jgi:hypothetical protein
VAGWHAYAKIRHVYATKVTLGLFRIFVVNLLFTEIKPSKPGRRRDGTIPTNIDIVHLYTLAKDKNIGYSVLIYIVSQPRSIGFIPSKIPLCLLCFFVAIVMRVNPISLPVHFPESRLPFHILPGETPYPPGAHHRKSLPSNTE